MGERGGSGETGTGLAYLAALVFLWGGAYTWVKIAMRDVGPLWFNLIRYGVAVTALAVVFLARGRAERMLPVKGERVPLALIGLLQAGLMTTMTALAMRTVEASRVVLIAYTMPIWALLFGVLIGRERITATAAAGVALGLAGLGLLTSPLTMAWSPAVLPGSLIALLGVFGWAVGAVLYRHGRWASPAWTIVFWQLLAVALASALLAPLLEDVSGIRPTWEMAAIGLYTGLFPILIGFFCWMQALARMPAHTAGQILILAPLYGVVQSHLVLGEPLGSGLALATLLVLAGAWLTLRPAGRKGAD